VVQAEKDNDEPYFCLSDFVAPKGSGLNDYVGMFACSAGHGLDKVVEAFKEVSDGGWRKLQAFSGRGWDEQSVGVQPLE
jgi:cobalamin-dependent methionine synthase I